MNYEELLKEADICGLITKEKPLSTYDGRIKGNKIAIRKDIPTLREKSCVLAEELGHFHTSTGNILDMQPIKSQKQELKARLWAYDKQIGLTGMVESYKRGCQNLYEMAEYLDVTEDFLRDAIHCYRSKYGEEVAIGNYIIYFEPYFGIYEKFR